MGVKTTAVSDIATHGGKVLEATTDWYAQDEQGNVWYFGEATKATEPRRDVRHVRLVAGRGARSQAGDHDDGASGGR